MSTSNLIKDLCKETGISVLELVRHLDRYRRTLTRNLKEKRFLPKS